MTAVALVLLLGGATELGRWSGPAAGEDCATMRRQLVAARAVPAAALACRFVGQEA